MICWPEVGSELKSVLRMEAIRPELVRASCTVQYSTEDVATQFKVGQGLLHRQYSTEDVATQFKVGKGLFHRRV
jgi:hypothetical protein